MQGFFVLWEGIQACDLHHCPIVPAWYSIAKTALYSWSGQQVIIYGSNMLDETEIIYGKIRSSCSSIVINKVSQAEHNLSQGSPGPGMCSSLQPDRIQVTYATPEQWLFVADLWLTFNSPSFSSLTCHAFNWIVSLQSEPALFFNLCTAPSSFREFIMNNNLFQGYIEIVILSLAVNKPFTLLIMNYMPRRSPPMNYVLTILKNIYLEKK